MEASVTIAGSIAARRESGAFLDVLDERTLRLLEFRRRRGAYVRRGWIMRRILLVADSIGLLVAFALTAVLAGTSSSTAGGLAPLSEFGLFALTLPVWILAAKLHGLYERDEAHASHTTVQEFTSVAHVVTLGTWIVFAGSWLTGINNPEPPRLVLFWLVAVASMIGFRTLARYASRDHIGYLQNAVIVGAGDIGQLVARKLLQHHEYGINVVGFIDDQPKGRRGDLGMLSVLGGPERLPEVIELLDVERVIVAFSNEPDQRTLDLIRSLRELDVHIDVVPRLFEVLGSTATIHDVEGLPLVGLPPVRLSRSSRVMKRGLDIVVAGTALLLFAPLFAFVAWRIKRDSAGPVFFRQTRLGFNMQEFTALKFRTMVVDVDESVHRAYIASTMDASAVASTNGIYKLERANEVTAVGRWLRKTSLDELPQLINILRGEMSLVGPRPCIPYETEHFRAHHFERFLVPAGLTGLWQVKARAQSTFGEALDLDVSYARSWSLGLDLELLCRTPFALLRQRKATA
jgi:exopolysaccharide biosynthesis polyprenyl glycosylphosphotransferase